MQISLHYSVGSKTVIYTDLIYIVIKEEIWNKTISEF